MVKIYLTTCESRTYMLRLTCTKLVHTQLGNKIVFEIDLFLHELYSSNLIFIFRRKFTCHRHDFTHIVKWYLSEFLHYTIVPLYVTYTCICNCAIQLKILKLSNRYTVRDMSVWMRTPDGRNIYFYD